MYGEFSLPQQDLARLKTGLPVRVTMDTYPGKVFTASLLPSTPILIPSRAASACRRRLPTRISCCGRACLRGWKWCFLSNNPCSTIPATAVLSAPYGDSVYVIEPGTNAAGGLVVRQQFIRVGRTRGDFVSVVSGLKPGERVVSSGLFKLRNRMSVVENNELTPKSEKKPTPVG